MKVGQKYTFTSDENHPSPYFIVCAIDNENGSDIASVYFGGLEFVNPQSETGYGHDIGHAPIEAHCLADSTITLAEENVELPDYINGYNTWREAFTSGHGGYFRDSAAVVVKMITQTLIE